MKQETEIKILRQLNKMLRNDESISLSLFPPKGTTIIEKEGNTMYINGGTDGTYHDVSEAFYDLMVTRFHTKK